jgi:hypothetical protein
MRSDDEYLRWKVSSSPPSNRLSRISLPCACRTIGSIEGVEPLFHKTLKAKYSLRLGSYVMLQTAQLVLLSFVHSCTSNAS